MIDRKWYEAPNRWRQELRCVEQDVEAIVERLNEWDEFVGEMIPVRDGVVVADRVVVLSFYAEGCANAEVWLRDSEYDCELTGTAVEIGPDPAHVAELLEERQRVEDALSRARLAVGSGANIRRTMPAQGETAELRGVIVRTTANEIVLKTGHDDILMVVSCTVDAVRNLELVPVYCGHQVHRFDFCMECAKNVRLWVNGLMRRPVA